MSFIVKGSYLKSPAKFLKCCTDIVDYAFSHLEKKRKHVWDRRELTLLILSAIRSNDFNMVQKKGRELLIDEKLLLDWLDKKLIPNTIILRLDDEDIIKLLLFSLEITYQMFAGGSRATVSQKGFRDRRRTFESVLVDQFIGKLGEVALKKFLESEFDSVRVELDWSISRDLETYRGRDILNSKFNVSVKTTSALEGVWAEAEKESDYGVFVKASIPQAPVLQFFIETCGFTKLIDFAESKLTYQDELFKDYMHSIRQRLKDYECGDIKSAFKCFICGYFRTKEYELVEKGVHLEYLGEVRESRYLVRVSDLLYSQEDWLKFIREVFQDG